MSFLFIKERKPRIYTAIAAGAGAAVVVLVIVVIVAGVIIVIVFFVYREIKLQELLHASVNF